VIYIYIQVHRLSRFCRRRKKKYFPINVKA